MNNHAEVRVKVQREDWEAWHKYLSETGQKQSDLIRAYIRQRVAKWKGRELGETTMGTLTTEE